MEIWNQILLKKYVHPPDFKYFGLTSMPGPLLKQDTGNLNYTIFLFMLSYQRRSAKSTILVYINNVDATRRYKREIKDNYLL
jgi:hypothetical protein